MKILTLCGSSSRQSQNRQLLQSIATICPEHHVNSAQLLTTLPLYSADDDHSAVQESVTNFRRDVRTTDAIIISTPEYLYNMPAVLKNALEWLKSGGEMQHKKVIAITYTPHAPRGKKAMVSLLESLKALDAQVLCSLSLYSTDLHFTSSGQLSHNGSLDLLQEAIAMLSE